MGQLSNQKYGWQIVIGICYALLLCALTGCGSSASDSGSDTTSTTTSNSGAASPAAASDTGKAAAPGKVAPPAIPRKIIYDATVDLVADNLTTAQQKLLRIVKHYNGYISEANVGGQAGTQRDGTWKIRIPAEQFEACMADIAKLGELQSTQTKSQDVTAEFYDVQAHIANKQVEEQRLVMHLKQSTARLQDILTVEHELSRVRGEIEELQGRLRVLSNLTTLSTITVAIHETKEFVPPKPTTFGQQIARSFHESIVALQQVLEALILFLVSLIPWFVVVGPIGFVIWLVARRGKRQP